MLTVSSDTRRDLQAAGSIDSGREQSSAPQSCRLKLTE